MHYAMAEVALMRVTDDGTSRAVGRRAAGRPAFSEALRIAARRRASAALPGAGIAPAIRRAQATRHASALTARRDAFADAQGMEAPLVPPAPRNGEAAQVGAPELPALVRALPAATPAILRAGAPLALAFGRSLEVELRPTERGVELLLRVERRLATACEAGLSGLVAALARRGVAVARAEVRPRPAPHGHRVDLPPGLR
jgi:hypothetical protein